jgi:hypothetical protein
MADPRGGWTTVDSLRPGAVFVRRDGSVWTRGFYRDAAGREADCLPHAHPFAASTLPADTPARPLDVPALARENADLRAMVADLWEESRAFAAGVEVGRGEALAALQELSPQSVSHSGTALISRTLVTVLDAVRCGTALFLQHAAALFRAAPITEVRLGDVRPSRSWNEGRHSHVWTWWSPGNGPAASQVPAAVWRNLVPPRDAYPMPWHRISVKDYPSPEAAHAALSAACTRYGRSLAGLPALAPA